MKDKLPLSLSPEEALKIATDAYIYGYPLVLMDVTREVMTAVPKPGARKAPVNRSILPDNTANFGTDYAWRAVVAMVGLGANLPEDAVYPHATADSEGQPFVGTNKYVIRFEKGQLPPARAFWSITMYNAQQFLVQNPIHRYAIGDRDKLKFDADGSLPIYVQSVSPGQDKESNWLPTPHDSFNLFMRLYWPTDEVLNGRWTIPAVERVHD